MLTFLCNMLYKTKYTVWLYWNQTFCSIIVLLLEQSLLLEIKLVYSLNKTDHFVFLLQLSLYPDKSSFSFFFHFLTSILLFYRIMTVITPSKAEFFRFWQVCCLQLPNIQAKHQKWGCRFTGSLCIFKFYFAALARSMNDVNLPMHSEGAWLIVSLRTPAFSTDLTSELPILPSKLRSPAYFV